MNPVLPPDRPRLTRRRLLAGGLGAALLLGAAACGGAADAGAPASSSAATSATRQVDTVNGPVAVPVDPQRIVSIQPSATATLYDVGVDPVGVYDQGSSYISPRYQQKWDAADKIGSGGEIDVEKVAALHPDLIIGLDYEWNTKVYDQLTALAPTVIAPTTSWPETAATVAQAAGRPDQLASLQQQLATRSTEIKQTYATPLAEHTWDLLQGGFDAGQFWVYGPGSDIGTVLTGAGVQLASASAQSPGQGPRTLSYEEIGSLADADVIGFYANYDGTPTNEAPALFAQAGFAALPAVQAGHTVPIPDFLPGGYGDALAVLDQLEAGLKTL